MPRAIISGCILAAISLSGRIASTQTAQTGAIRGVVTDRSTGEPLAGVTIAVTSTSSEAVLTEMTDASGYYKITNLAPGRYDVLFVFAKASVRRANVRVAVNKTVLINGAIDVTSSEEIYIDGKEPLTDPSSATQRRTLGPEYFRTIPRSGVDYDSALEAAAGSTEDAAGTAHGGGTSPESQYYLDGVSTTGVAYGTLVSPLRSDFLEEIDIITGGYEAEYGRSTGAVVNVVTKQGGNQFRGSVFSYFSSSALAANVDGTFSQSSAIAAESDTAYDLTLGFELGGPIIEDKLWFYVGASPRLIAVDTDKITRRRTDCRVSQPDGQPSSCDPGLGDGRFDEDENGLLIFEELDRTRRRSRGSEYQFVSKINAAPSADHQGQISLTGSPSQTDRPGITGDPRATSVQTSSITTDLAMKWTSKFDDSRTELEAIAGWHRARNRVEPIADEARDIPRQTLLFGNLGTWSMLGFESAATRAGCADSTDRAVDPYPFIENCPDAGVGYDIGGIGGIRDDFEQRASLQVRGTRRVDAAGKHEIKAGMDVEDNRLNRRRLLSGDAFFTNVIGNSVASVSPRVEVFRYAQLAPPDGDPARFGDICGSDPETGDPIACDWSPDPDVDGNTVNWSAYLRDSWAVLPNLVFNAGVRYEEQRLRYAEHLRGTIDPFTGRSLGDNAMLMRNMWAPRVGVIYDWTRSGQSKLYGAFARYFESIPMDINDRSFGGETSYRQTYDSTSQCGPSVPGIGGVDGTACDSSQPPALGDQLFGSGVLVAPGIRPQYLDELLFGVEYQPVDDLVVGATYQNRRLGRVIEDVSTDGARTYVLANPGSFSAEEERQLEQQIDALPDGDPERERLSRELELYRGIRTFDEPRRDYDAITLTAQRRFFGRLYAVGSYTYSRTSGNFPGLLSADNGQLDPNITSQYDLIELLANRDGALPQDRPHNLKVDASYMFDLDSAGTLTAGTRLRALSGTPVTALGRHHLYGTNEAFLLPRGAMGRTAADYTVDLRLIYGRALSDGMALELFADVFSIFNRQTQAAVDQAYTFDAVNPIVGGQYEDLVFAKSQSDSGGETNTPAGRNRNFMQTTARNSPLSARLGARLTF